MRIPYRLFALALLLGSCGWSLPADAQESNETPRNRAADQDGARRAQGRRGARDGNRAQDQPAEGMRRIAMIMQLFDEDRSGDLSIEEINAMANKMKAMDQNQDGRVTPAEVLQSVGQNRPGNRRPGAAGNAVPGAGPGNNRLGNADPKELMGRILARADKDGDGLISKEEAPPRLQENFDRLDADGDGKLSIDEMTSMLDRMRGNGRQRDGGQDLQGVEPKRPGKGGGDGTDSIRS